MPEKFNAAFWKWFGDSKVVNKDGSPMVVYHGSNSIFHDVDVDKAGFGFHIGSKAQAESVATKFRSQQHYIIPMYARIVNPLEMRDLQLWGVDDIRAHVHKRVNSRGETYAELRADIQAAGYDGIVYLNRWEGLSDDDENSVLDDEEYWREFEFDYGASDKEFKEVYPSAKKSWIIFSPTQVKLIDNDGSWDADDPDIRSNPKKVRIPDEEKDESGHRKAWDSYYDVGHKNGGVLWVYLGGSVEWVENKKDELHEDYWDLNDRTIRGRYDPKSGKLTILTYGARLIPQSVMDKIEAAFPDATDVIHYNTES